MKQVMNYNKENGLLNMIRRTDPMIKTLVSSDSLECSAYCFWLNCYKIGASLIPHPL